MRNCIILGSGRSGTSLAAGVLARAGYFMGEPLYPPDAGNPKGYFEGPAINGINEDILATMLPTRPTGWIGQTFFRSWPTEGQRWVATVELDQPVGCPDDVADRIEVLAAQEPYCFKDPRFSYTLSAWRPFLNDPVYVCIFRDPAVTVTSILKECERQPVLQSLTMNRKRAYAMWEAMYRHILLRHVPAGGEWLFVHYDQFHTGQAQALLSQHLGVPVDESFADASLNRSQPADDIPQRVADLYRHLCALAGAHIEMPAQEDAELEVEVAA